MSTKYTKRRRSKDPVPSARELLDWLADAPEPQDDKSLFAAFGLDRTHHRRALRKRLEELERNGQVLKNRRDRYAVLKRMDMIPGRVTGHADGFGFLIPDQGGGDLYLSPREMRKVLHGDRAIARVKGVDRRGRQEGTIIEVIERGNKTVVGRFVKARKMGFVVPDDTRINQDIYIALEDQGDALPEQIVVAELITQPDSRTQATGRIVEVLGEHLAPGMEVEIAIRKYGLPHEWPVSIEKQLRRVPAEVRPRDARGREDLTDLPLVTIDGEDARDFDDAVYCEAKRGGWRLIVAIADVSHYVKPRSAMDTEARERGNSVYFPERVIPMLPEPLSNGICSLNPGVDRLCHACEIDISRAGEIRDYRFFEAVMHSHARLTYTQVAAMIATGTTEDGEEARLPLIQELHALAQALRQRRMKVGSIDLDLPETRIVFDQDKKIESIEPTERNDAHRLIEECMLAANVCAADRIIRAKANGVFRVHDRPDPDKVEDLRGFLGEFGLSLPGESQPEPGHYAAVIAKVTDRPYAHVVQMAMLRSLSQAAYSSECSGHFALGFDRYTHFTSPIRRYPDLAVHRVIKALSARDQAAEGVADELALIHIAEHCSMTERRADDATRNVVQWLKAEFMQDRIGEQYWGIITGVTNFGVFVELEDVYVEGLVHVTALGNDYFHFDPVRRRLTGERSGHTYHLGDRLEVRVVRVDLDQAKIDFELVGTAAGGRRAQRGKKRRR